MRIPLLQPLLDWGRGLIRKLTVSRQTGGGRSWRNSRTYRTWCTLALARATDEFTYTGQISRREWAPCNVASLYRGGRNFCHRIVPRNDSRARYLTSRKKKGHAVASCRALSLRKREKKEKKGAILYYYVELLVLERMRPRPAPRIKVRQYWHRVCVDLLRRGVKLAQHQRIIRHVPVR